MRHPDEGEIHAWLDGALAPDEAARIEAHVATCARCAEEVATARGLIAGASRILLALDSVPGGVIPGRPATADMAVPAAGPNAGTGPVPLSSRTTKPTVRRQTPWLSRPLTRIAAGLVLAAGIGTVAVRRDHDAANRLTVELRTESVAESAGQAAPAPAVGDAFGGVPSTPPPVPPAGDRDGIAIARAAVRVQPQSRLPAATTGTGADQAARGAVEGVRGRSERNTDLGLAGGAVPAPAASTAVAEARSALSSNPASGIGPGAPVSPGARVAAPAAAGPPPAREEARAKVGTAGSSVATSTTERDSARRSRQSLRLESIVLSDVVSGAPTSAGMPPVASPAPLAAPTLGFAAGQASLAGSCYALELEAGAPVARGETPLPRTMRIRLADLQNVAVNAAQPPLRGGNLLADTAERLRRLDQRLRRVERSATAEAAAATPVEPMETVEWETVARDSIVARRLEGIDVVVLRLSVTGDEVRGTAAAQTATAAPVRVTGRRIACDGSF